MFVIIAIAVFIILELLWLFLLKNKEYKTCLKWVETCDVLSQNWNDIQCGRSCNRPRLFNQIFEYTIKERYVEEEAKVEMIQLEPETWILKALLWELD